MVSRESTQKFLKKFDKFARPVSLTFQERETFHTACGGICSICMFFFITFTFITMIFTSLIGNKFNDYFQTNMNTAEDVITIQPTDLIITNKITTINQALEDEGISRYILGVYMFRKYPVNDTLGTQGATFYESIPCANQFNNDSNDFQE